MSLFSLRRNPVISDSGFSSRELLLLTIPSRRRSLLARLGVATRTILGFVAIIWVVTAIDQFVFGGRLAVFGILPRNMIGLRGILFAPFLHAGFAHVIGNTTGIVLLGGALILRDEEHFWVVTFLGALAAGIGTWVFGRTALHIGASGVIFAYFGYLLSVGWYERRPGAILLSLAVFLGWGSLLLGLLPMIQGGVSWEAHLFGFVGGVLAARSICRRRAA